MNILIFGSSGYIGSHLIKDLSPKVSAILGFDLLDATFSLPNFKNIVGDIRNADFVCSTISKFKPNIIIDLASNTDVGPQFSLDDYSSNFGLPIILSDYISNNDCSFIQKIIFTSTQYVTGPDYSNDNLFAYAPHTVYGQSKVILESEILLSSPNYVHHGIEFSIVRPTNVWGGYHPKYSAHWEKLLSKSLVAIPYRDVFKSYCHISSLVELYVSLTIDKHSFLNYSDRIIYGTDALASQSDWISLQVDAFKRININAGFYKVPVFLLYFISFVLFFYNKKILPMSRIRSMLIDYPVPLTRLTSLPRIKTLSDLKKLVFADIHSRYSSHG